MIWEIPAKCAPMEYRRNRFHVIDVFINDGKKFEFEYDRCAGRYVKGMTARHILPVYATAHMITQQLFSPGHVDAQRERGYISEYAAQHIQLSARR